MIRATMVLSLGALVGCDGADPPQLFVASGFTDEVLVVDPTSGAIESRISVDPRPMDSDEPHGLALSPDGQFLYVTLAHGDPTVWKIFLDGSSDAQRVRLEAGGAARIDVSSDGRRGFVPDYDRALAGKVSRVTVLDLTIMAVDRHLTLCPAPHHAAIDPTGSLVAIACSLSDEIVMIDAETGNEVRRFFVDSSPGPAGAPTFKPLNAVWSPSGATLYVGLHNARTVVAFGRSGERVAAAEVGAAPAHLVAMRQGQVLVTTRGDSGLTVLTPQVEVLRQIRLSVAHPRGIVLDARQEVAFITFEGDAVSPGGVVAIEVASGRELWRLDEPTYALGVAYRPGS